MLEIRNLTKCYGDKKVLDDISLDLETGRIISLMGANGSGKTTLFKSLLGLTGFQGSACLDGRPLDNRRIGYLPEERSLFPDCSVERQLLLFAGLKGLGKRESEEAVRNLAEKLKIVPHLNKCPSLLSKGNQQKVQLAVALISDPELLILDEPWTGLDASNARLFERMLRELRRKGKTVLLSSHQYQPVQRICDRYLYLHRGKVIVNMSREDLESDERRIITVTTDQYLLLESDGILNERRKGGQVKYLVRDAECAGKLLAGLQDDPAVTALSLRRLQIEDYLEEY